MDETAQMSTSYRRKSFIRSSVLGIILSLISSMEAHFPVIPFFHANRMTFMYVCISMCNTFIN